MYPIVQDDKLACKYVVHTLSLHRLLLHSFKAGSEDKPASIVNPLLKLSIRWRVNTGKCVDCSPLLAKTPLSEEPIVFIGSHSGAFLAIELKTGREKWRRQLPDRIESSACLSMCGSYVVVGETACYLTEHAREPEVPDSYVYTVEPLYSGHPWDYKKYQEVSLF